jgi:hypothetical protein
MTLQWRNGVSVDDPMFHISSAVPPTKIHAPPAKADHLVACRSENLCASGTFFKRKATHNGNDYKAVGFAS